MFKIYSIGTREELFFKEDLIIYGFTIEPDDFSKTEEFELTDKVFSVILNKRDHIWINVPMMLGHKDYVNVKSAITFKFVRPFIIKGGESLMFEPNSSGFEGNLLLYTIPPSETKEGKLFSREADKTRLLGVFINTSEISDNILFNDNVRIISLGFAVPHIDGTDEKWKTVYTPGAANILSGNIEYDIRVRILTSSGINLIADRKYRAIKSFAGDLQDGTRLILKGFNLRENENLQIAFEKSIDTLNATRTDKYGRLFILAEYVRI